MQVMQRASVWGSDWALFFFSIPPQALARHAASARGGRGGGGVWHHRVLKLGGILASLCWAVKTCVYKDVATALHFQCSLLRRSTHLERHEYQRPIIFGRSVCRSVGRCSSIGVDVDILKYVCIYLCFSLEKHGSKERSKRMYFVLLRFLDITTYFPRHGVWLSEIHASGRSTYNSLHAA